MSKSTDDRWNEAVQVHAKAAAALAQTAAAIPAGLWREPWAAGKWNPAEVAQHLILAYEVLLRELGGGSGMALRTKRWQRLLLWYTLRPRLLAGKPFPKGARAPREVRPTAPDEPQMATVQRFRDTAARFAESMETTRSERPQTRLTHAYFGTQPLEEVMRFVAAHIHHHRKQLGSIGEATVPAASPRGA